MTPLNGRRRYALTCLPRCPGDAGDIDRWIAEDAHARALAKILGEASDDIDAIARIRTAQAQIHAAGSKASAHPGTEGLELLRKGGLAARDLDPVIRALAAA